MAYISEEEINKIRQEANIVDVVADYLDLRPKGRNFVALCPFHNDHSPSLVVSPERQIFNCFTCRTGGNVFSFVMKYENVEFLEAVAIVAKKIGYNLHFDPTKSHNKVNKKEYQMYDLASKYFINNLNTPDGLKAKEYLASRGIDESIIKEFNLGLALNQKADLNNFLTHQGFTETELVQMGLINQNGLDTYDVFTNRIMIPVSDFTGQVVAFTGRIFNNEEDTAKYINTKETSIYKKSNILFNYHNAKKAMKNAGYGIIVEGNMDAIMLSAKGIKNVVALMGVAISASQIEELSKLRIPFILILDNDNAGLQATAELGDKMVASGLDVKVVRLSGAKDPDEYIRAFGLEALKNNLANPQSYLDFKLNYLKGDKDLQTVTDVVKYIREVLASLTHYDDLTKDMIITKLSKKYDIDKEVLKQNLAVKPKIETEAKPPEKGRKNKYDKAVATILYAMMNDAKYIRVYKEKLGYFKNKIERIIASEIVYYNNSYEGINIADFMTFVQDKTEISEVVNDIINYCGNEELSMDNFNSCIDIVLQELKKDEINELKNKMKQEMDINKKVEMLEKIAALKKEV